VLLKILYIKISIGIYCIPVTVIIAMKNKRIGILFLPEYKFSARSSEKVAVDLNERLYWKREKVFLKRRDEV
jgi:hypothetical protein